MALGKKEGQKKSEDRTGDSDRRSCSESFGGLQDSEGGAVEIAVDMGVCRMTGLYAFWKRAGDIFLSALLLMLLALPMMLIAVVVRCDSPGGALFCQTRVGRDLRPFTICKFRTMTATAPHDAPSATFSEGERRRYLTRVGRFLRRSSLDELPQLWNILRGEMSFVGPRPVIPEESRLISMRALLGAASVRPGLTGLSQVEGRDDRDALTKAYLDSLYVRRMSFSFDCFVLARTVKTVLAGKGSN